MTYTPGDNGMCKVIACCASNRWVIIIVRVESSECRLSVNLMSLHMQDLEVERSEVADPGYDTLPSHHNHVTLRGPSSFRVKVRKLSSSNTHRCKQQGAEVRETN
jgi:hypothetical protein